MKKKELQDLAKRSTTELEEKVADLRVRYVKLQHELAMGTSDNSAGLRNIKKDIAQALTIIGQMRLNPQVAVEAPKEEVKKAPKKEVKKEK